MTDLISRQAAKDEFMKATADGDKVEFCWWVLDRLPTIDAVPREDYEATIYAREQNAYDRGLTDGRKEQLMTSGYVTTSTDEPPVVYAEQKRGKWKEDIGGFSCTVCGYHTDDDEIGNWDITFGRWKYCPSCGAKMERSEDGN